MKTEFELMDWKDIERASESQIRDANKTTAIAKYLLFWAQDNIKKLGGQTNEEEDKEAKKNQMGQMAEGSPML